MSNITTQEPNLNTLEGLAIWIGAQCPVLEAAKLTYTKGSLAIGAAIVLYSESPEVKKECKAANETKGRGRPWTEIGYVAAQLEELHTALLPSAKWMLSCAKAAQIAREKGMIDGNVKKLLGWQSAMQIDEKQLKEVEVGKLLNLPGVKPDNSEKTVAELIEALSSVIAAKVTGLAGKKIGAREIATLIEEANPTLEHIGVALAPLPKSHRRLNAKRN